MATSKDSLSTFLENQTCVVVDPSKSFQASIQHSLKSLGLPSLTIILLSKYDDAQKRIAEIKPRVVITEYDIDGQKGLSLVEQQQRIHEDQLCLSIMISKNSSDSVVAEAAEEQIDCFLLKPFSTDDFCKKMANAIESKVNPSKYSLKIKEGRKAFADKNFEKAHGVFREAKTLHERPSLACFYLGDTARATADLTNALEEFKQGRTYNSLHYKCLIGEFEVLVEKKDYTKANDLIPVLIKNFPLTPKRLTQVFIAAVFSMHFEHLPAYYEQLQKLDHRSPELVRIASIALFTGGKYYIQKNDRKQAMDLFEKAVSIATRDINMIEQIIKECEKVGAKQEIKFFSGKLKAAK